jgi:hypothetical protein
MDDGWSSSSAQVGYAMNAIPDRWNPYFMADGSALKSVLMDHFASERRRVGFVMGRGFDPRMNSGLTWLSETKAVESLEVALITFNEGEQSASRNYEQGVNQNLSELNSLVPSDRIIPKAVSMWSNDGRRQTSRSAERVFRSYLEISKYTDLIVDVSALPRSIYFPIIAKLLHLIDSQQKPSPNLLVLVSENPELDTSIIEQDIDEEADFLHPFRGGADREARAVVPRVWYPILGEGQQLQLERIRALVKPDEICPMLPAPARNPRRGDALIAEYHTLLFDAFDIEPGNILYGSELNPFEAYRQLRTAILHYQDALAPIGGSRHVLSALSSKLLSFSTLLVAYELKKAGIDIGIAHIEADGYAMEVDVARHTGSTLYGLWLTGEIYA